MRYEFDFQMDEKTLGDFYMSHNFMGGSAMLWPLIGVVAIALAFLSGEATPMIYRGVYVVFGLLFIFYIPWDLKKKAKKQLKVNPYYAEPIHYVLDEEGITTTQGENTATLSWDKFSKIKILACCYFKVMTIRIDRSDPLTDKLRHHIIIRDFRLACR